MTDQAFVDFYALLGVSPEATREEIERAFRRLARQYHPDVNPEPDAQERFQLLLQARETLLDPKRRALYDRQWSEHYGVPLRERRRERPEPTQPPRTEDRHKETAPIEEAAWLVETLYSRPGLVAGVERQRLYMLTRWHPPAPARPVSAQHPLFVCLVVDRSTSMKGASLGLLRQLVGRLLTLVTPQDTLSLIAFNDRAHLLVPPGPNQAEAVRLALDRLQPEGATEFLPALQLAMEVFHRRPPRALPWLLFFTDGRTYDQDQVLAWLPALQQAQVLLDAFGLGTEWDENFLERVATVTGGTVTYLRDLQEATEHLTARWQRLRRAYLVSARMVWETPPPLTLNTVVRLAPDLAYYPSGLTELRLGPVMAGECWQLLWEWTLNQAMPAGERVVFSVEIEARLPSGKRWTHRQRFERPVLPEAEVRAVTPPKKLVEAVRRLTWHRLQERAREALHRRNPRQAYRYLQALAHHLSQAGELQMARVVRQEMRTLKRRAAMSPEGEKRLKFGTQRLMLPAVARKNA